jgi:hypothetical protein
MNGNQNSFTEAWRQIAHIRDREITANERFWLEVIRLASWDSDPPPTLDKVQKLRMIFQPARETIR